MDDKRIKSLTNSASYVTQTYGYTHIKEDFSQHLLMKFIEKPDSRSSTYQVLVDYLRSTQGHSRTEAGKIKMAANTDGIELTEKMFEDMTYPSLESQHLDSYSFLFEDTRGLIYHAYFVEGYEIFEIAKNLNLSIGRISQLLKEIKIKIRKCHFNA